MSTDITAVYKDSGEYGPNPPIYIFEFADGVFVAVSENVVDRYAKYDGKRFEAWHTSEEYASSASEVSVEEAPDNITVDEVYITEGEQYEGDTEVSTERIEAIGDFV